MLDLVHPAPYKDKVKGSRSKHLVGDVYITALGVFGLGNRHVCHRAFGKSARELYPSSERK